MQVYLITRINQYQNVSKQNTWVDFTIQIKTKSLHTHTTQTISHTKVWKILHTCKQNQHNINIHAKHENTERKKKLVPRFLCFSASNNLRIKFLEKNMDEYCEPPLRQRLRNKVYWLWKFILTLQIPDEPPLLCGVLGLCVADLV